MAATFVNRHTTKRIACTVTIGETPLEGICRATPPRKHRHRYHGVFAPNHKPLTAFHATVRTAREKSGFQASLRQ